MNNNDIEDIAVIGSGSWATALVKMLMEQPVRVRWWMRKEQDQAYILKHGHNPNYLSGVDINLEKVRVYTDLNRCVRKADLLVIAVPSAFIEQALNGLEAEHLVGKTIVAGTKGMVPEHNQLVTDYIGERFGLSSKQFVVIAGPCHAEEVALERLSYLTLAGEDQERTETTAKLLACDYIRTAWHTDVYGAEYCAIMKNIVAIASGICHGLNNGDNFQAVLVANGFREMKRFIDEAFPKHRALIDTAYLGDLLVTAYSQFSRNRSFGNMIGRGYSVRSAQMEMNMIAEGYYAVKSIHKLNKTLGIDLPIMEAVYAILYKEKSPHKVIEDLKTKLN